MKEQLLNDDLLRESNIPERHWTQNLNTYWGDKSALESVCRYVNAYESAYENGIGLFITGPADTMKTFLMCHVLKELMRKGADVYYIGSERLIETYFARDSGFVNLVSSPQWLALDGVDSPQTGGKKEGLSLAVDQAIRARKDSGKPTLIASQLTFEMMRECYKESTLRYIDNNLKTVNVRVDAIKKQLSNKNRKDKVPC